MIPQNGFQNGKAAKVFVPINKENDENKFVFAFGPGSRHQESTKFIQSFSSSERVIAYKKAQFTFIKFPDIQILLQDSQLYQYLSNKSFGTSGDVNLGCELTLVQKHVFLFFFFFF